MFAPCDTAAKDIVASSLDLYRWCFFSGGLFFRFCYAEMILESGFNMRALGRWNFLPFRFNGRVFIQKIHSHVEMMCAHAGIGIRFMLDVFNGLKYHSFRAFNVRMFELMLMAQATPEASCVKIVWREAIIAHTR